MKTRFTLIVLGLMLLTVVAQDTPRRATVDEDMIVILKVAREYRPEGTTRAQVERVPAKDMAYVRYSVRRNGHDVAMAVVTLKKTSKGWEVESCAR